MMIEAFGYWVREFDVDGFRVDVAWGIRERNPDFWSEWRRALKRIKPDLLLLAEATAREPYYFDNGFDAAYDWTYRPGGWAWEIIWSAYKYRLLSYNLTEALTNRPEGFHPDALITFGVRSFMLALEGKESVQPFIPHTMMATGLAACRFHSTACRLEPISSE